MRGNMKIRKIISLILVITLSLTACKYLQAENQSVAEVETTQPNSTTETNTETTKETDTTKASTINLDDTIITYDVPLEKFVVEAEIQYNNIQVEEVYLDEKFRFATYSQINTGFAKLYKNNSYNKKEGTICVNAGHGVKGGEKYPKTYAHPDFTKKLTSGTNGKTEKSYAISSGMTFPTGEAEHEINLKVAMYLRDVLLANGYSVLMIREDSDSYLDNIARTVLANNYADCHVSIHFDSTETGAGIFCITASRKEAYLKMDPVKDIYKKSDEFADMLITTFKKYNEKIRGKGIEYQDLTQISYSTIPTVDLELGDKKSDISDARLHTLSEELYDGIDEYMKVLYGKNS